MKNTLKTTFLVLLIAIMGAGCVSSHVMEGSRRLVGIRKAIATNNEAAIQALKNGESTVNAGINVTAWEAISERPILQTGAAITDGLIVWGGYEGVRWLSDQSSSNEDGNRNTLDSGRDSTVINVSGDGNTVQVRGDETNTGIEAASE